MSEPDSALRAGHALGDPSVTSVVVALGVGIVVVGLLVGRFARGARRHVFSAAVATLLYVCAIGAASSVAGTDWEPRARAIAALFWHIAAIDLVGTLIFYVVLPRVRADLPEILRDLLIACAYLGAVAALLFRFGVDVTGLAASGAAVTVLIGLALQATLGNAVGGVALRLDGSIREGEWIRLPDKAEGIVRSIRWRHTEVETRNGDTLIVPNAQLIGQSILILGRHEGGPRQHRMWVYFDVDFRFAPGHVIEVVEAGLHAAPIESVAELPPPNCICFDLTHEGTTASAARYAVRYFLLDLRRDDPTSSAVRGRIHAALGRAQIPLATPAQSVVVTEANKKHAERTERDEQARRCGVIDEIGLFRSLTADERAAIAARLVPAPFAAGEIITKQGAEAHWLYLLAEGRADIRVRVADRPEMLVAEVSAPTIFGEMSLMTGEPRRATVRATSPSFCYRLDKAGFADIVKRRPEIASEMSEFLAHRIVELDEAIEEGDKGTHGDRMSVAHGRILSSVKSFFGLDDEPGLSPVDGAARLGEAVVTDARLDVHRAEAVRDAATAGRVLGAVGAHAVVGVGRADAIVDAADRRARTRRRRRAVGAGAVLEPSVGTDSAYAVREAARHAGGGVGAVGAVARVGDRSGRETDPVGSPEGAAERSVDAGVAPRRRVRAGAAVGRTEDGRRVRRVVGGLIARRRRGREADEERERRERERDRRERAPHRAPSPPRNTAAPPFSTPGQLSTYSLGCPGAETSIQYALPVPGLRMSMWTKRLFG